MNMDSQWSKQEACFARATPVWLAVNHNTSVTSGEVCSNLALAYVYFKFKSVRL